MDRGHAQTALVTRDVSKLIGRSTERTRQLVREGRLRASVTSTGMLLFDPADVEQFLRDRDGE